jgi:hypothetical protein
VENPARVIGALIRDIINYGKIPKGSPKEKDTVYLHR